MDEKISEEIIAFLKLKIVENGGIELNENTPFLNIAINSIQYIQLIVLLEQKYGFEFDDEELLISYFKDIKQLAEHIKQKISK